MEDSIQATMFCLKDQWVEAIKAIINMNDIDWSYSNLQLTPIVVFLEVDPIVFTEA